MRRAGHQGPATTRWAAGNLPRGFDEVLDAFARRDPADVEDEWRVCGDVQLRTQRAVCGAAVAGVRKTVAAHVHLPGIHAAGDHCVTLARRRDDHRCSAARDAAVERPVECSLEQYLAQPWLEHAEWLEDVRHASYPAPRSGAGGDRVAEAEDVHDVRTAQTRQRDRERRCDPHPPIAKRRCEVVDGRAVHYLHGRPGGGPLLEIEDRRRDHLDGVSMGHQAADELPGGHDRAAERA